ncbi:MAG: L,D-transpeptidase family protein [Rhodopseudomonas sp.]|nr:L,D-transpeptidase family protein [Rhodopseudomonas sp.]
MPRCLAALLVIVTALAGTSAAAAHEIVPFHKAYRPGTIVVATNARQLFYVLNGNKALRYPVGVGKAGMAWQGRAYIAQKDIAPDWALEPGVTPTIPGGSPRNPMGAAAMGLDHGNYAIHGTNDPSSIGRFVSHGCIRMFNADIMDLYRRAPLGTEVVVVQ